MNKIFMRFLFFFSTILGLTCSAFPENLSTQGTLFYASFMKNGYRGCNGPMTNENLTVIVSSPRTCQVTLQSFTGWSTTETVTGGVMRNITVPATACYNTLSETVSSKTLKITSTDTISLFIANEATNSFDASLVLPLHALGERYITQHFVPSTTDSWACPSATRSCFLVIATEDSTLVQITPSVSTAEGHDANIPFSILLNEGDCYQVISANGGQGGDLSGSRVESLGCEKIALFNGNVLTGIPLNLTEGFDHIFEQAIPVNFWGRRFAPIASLNRQGDFVKITASENNTQVRINGALATTLNAYESHLFHLVSTDTACFVETSMPSLLYLYHTTSEYDNSSLGDPSMLWIAPIEQQIQSIMFCTFSAQSITSHYLNVVVADSNTFSLFLDNLPVTAANLHPLPGNPAYSYARLSITAGTHSLRSTGGFLAFVYGFGEHQGYGYAVGANAVPFQNDILVNQMPGSQLSEEDYFCLDTPLHFALYAPDPPDTVAWIVDGQPAVLAPALDLSFPDTGIHHVAAILTFVHSECTPPSVDTLSLWIRVADLSLDLFDTICSGMDYHRHGFHFTAHQDTTALRTVPNPGHCDSLVVLHLSAQPARQVTEEVYLCSPDYYCYRGDTLRQAGIYVDSLLTEHGCDSVFTLLLHVIEPQETRIEDRVCLNEPYHRGNLYVPPHTVAGTYTYEFPRSGQYGCDSLVRLTLTVPDVRVAISNSDHDFCRNRFLVLQAITPNKHFIWNTGESTPSIEVTKPGSYHVVAFDDLCQAEATFYVDPCPFHIFLPNAISPGRGDGVNDAFFVNNPSEIKELIITIYDRWGTAVFYSRDPAFRWDGTVRGEPALNQIFNYTLFVTPYQGKQQKITGTVIVL